MSRRVLLHTNAAKAKRPSHFDYPVVLLARTDHFSIYCDPGTGAAGRAAGQHIASGAEADYQTLASIFALPATHAPQHFNAIVAPLSAALDGSGGAYHHSCIAADLYCDVDTASVQTTRAFLVAEAAEVFAATQTRGWDCSASNGEGLSRYLAEIIHPGVLDEYESASMWVEAGKPDWVSKTNPTDQDGASFGCAVLFLFWLQHKGYSAAQIVQAGSSTLEGTYRALSGETAAFEPFLADVSALPRPITMDDPWSDGRVEAARAPSPKGPRVKKNPR